MQRRTRTKPYTENSGEKTLALSKAKAEPDSLTVIRNELAFPRELAQSTLELGIHDQTSKQIEEWRYAASLDKEVKKSEADLSEIKKFAIPATAAAILLTASALASSLQEGLFVLVMLATGPGVLAGIKVLQSVLTKKGKREISVAKIRMEDRTELIDGMHEALAELPPHQD
jgi:hypothetical protein